MSAPPTSRTGRGSGPSLSRVVVRACAAEWTRLWTVRGTWAFLAAAAVAMLGIGAIAGFDAAADPDLPADAAAWAVVTVAAMPAQFALLGLALSAVTTDHATGGIVPTLQWTPRRPVLFLARTLVTVAAATILGTVLGLACALTAAAAAPAVGLPWNEGLDALGTVAFVVAAGSALAVGLGFLLRSTAAALVTVFLLVLVLPVLLPQFGYEWLTEVAQLMPGTGAAHLLLEELPGMTQASSVTVLLGWAGGALLLGGMRLVRDDANR